MEANFKPNNIKLSGAWGRSDSMLVSQQRNAKTVGKRRITCLVCFKVSKNAGAFKQHKRTCPDAKAL